MFFSARVAFVGVFTLIGTAFGQTNQSVWFPKTELAESIVELSRVAVAELSADGSSVYAYQPLYRQGFGPTRHTEYFQSSPGKVVGSRLLIDEWHCTPVAIAKYELSIDTPAYFDLDGKTLNRTRVKEILAKPIGVLISNSPTPKAIDDYYKSVFDKDIVQIAISQKANDDNVVRVPSTVEGLQAWTLPTIKLPKRLARIHIKNVSVAKISTASDKLLLDLLVPQYINHQLMMMYEVPVEVTSTEEVVGPDGKAITKTKTSFQFQTETKNSFVLEPRAVVRFAIPVEKVRFESVDGRSLNQDEVASRLKRPTHIVFFDGDSGSPFLDPFYASVFAKDCIVAEVSEPWRYASAVREIAITKP
jgi:hypothetical protein